MKTPTLTGQLVIDGVPVIAETVRRINACLTVCEGISTSVLELNATAGGVATLERQRDNYRAVLKAAEYNHLDALGGEQIEVCRQVGAEARRTVLSLMVQRDELLAALERVVDNHVPKINPLSDAANLSAIAAIAKAQGGAQ